MEIPKNNSLVTLLRKLYANNFVIYYKSHGYHFNVQGNTFAQDHSLLQEVYEFLYEQHDMLGEQIRQMDKAAPTSLKEILSLSSISECTKVGESSKTMFTELVDDFNKLLEDGQSLYDDADMQSCGGLATLIGDYLKALSKLNWKVKATLGASL